MTERPIATPWDWRLTAASALLHVLAFNLTFFLQELFLVLPKAFTPGLSPTLFHNNHTWDGDHPLAHLFQGTGAAAVVLSGVVCAVLLRRGAGGTTTRRLFLIWMAFNGFFQALPQVVIGALSPRSDVGMAMTWLGFGTGVKTGAAIAALIVIPLVAWRLMRPVLELAPDPAHIAGGWARTRFVFQVVTLPALIALPLIIPFRVPREMVEVVVLPVLVTVPGVVWMQAGAWRMRRVATGSPRASVSVGYLLVAMLLLLAVFHLVLRPGIRF